MKNGDEIDQEMFKSIYGIMFFGVPNQGIMVEHWMRTVQAQPNEYLLQTLGLRSTYTRKVHDDFRDAFEQLEHSETIAIYETEKTRLSKVRTLFDQFRCCCR